MRKLIAGMTISADGKMEGPEGVADWVEAWSNDYGLMPHIDACVLGGGMYPGYEKYWTAVQNQPDKPLPMTGTLPTPDEVEWGRFAAQAPHYVLSSTLTSEMGKAILDVRSCELPVASIKSRCLRCYGPILFGMSYAA